MNDDDPAELLAFFKAEHRRLDADIDAMRGAGNCDPLELARMKKRKLGLKDQIHVLEDQLVPDYHHFARRAD